MKRLTKEIWLEEGLKVLSEIGESGLTMETLSKRLNVTRGSFYHHFKNRPAYIEEILAYWEKKMTLEIIKASKKAGNSFKDKNEILLTLSTVDNTSKLEVVIRSWALKNPIAKKYQQKVDKKRIQYLQELFSLLTNDNESQKLALIRYSFFIGTQHILPLMKKNTYNELAELLQKMITKII